MTCARVSQPESGRPSPWLVWKICVI